MLHGLLRLRFQFDGDPRVPPSLHERIERSALAFSYWPYEHLAGPADALCTWTENHQILFASASLLAGERWLAMRFRTGFSEWLSHVYYDADLVAVLALTDFASDPALRRRASMVTDLLFLDLAPHSFRGVFASTHGRSYEGAKKRAAEEGITDTAKLVLGVGSFARRENMSAACLALSPRYRPPALVAAIAADTGRTQTTIRQRMGIRLEELPRWGLDPARDEDAMELLSLEAYAHPRTIEGFVRLLDRYGWRSNAFFAPFAAARGLLGALRRLRLLRAAARALEWDLARNVRPEVDVVTFRTPDYQLSSALDWRPGMGGDQQHAWQATLGPGAVCFTTHPGSREARSPGRWTGSATLPRVGQVRNAAIVPYRIHRWPALHVPNRQRMTHAWLPRDRFDELVERDGWVFARRGDGYLALRSGQPVRWNEAPEAGEDRGRELVAEGRRHAWLCELGRRTDDGSFTRFVEGIASAPLEMSGARVRYRSPSQGWIELGWRGPLHHEGAAAPMRGSPRYDTPWGGAEFPLESVELRCAGERLRLAWEEGVRDGALLGDEAA